MDAAGAILISGSLNCGCHGKALGYCGRLRRSSTLQSRCLPAPLTCTERSPACSKARNGAISRRRGVRRGCRLRNPLREMLKRNNGGSVLKTLQDHRTLSVNVSTDFVPDYALIGAATPYARIHRLGGRFSHPARSVTVRLRTTAKGALVRQADHKNLAVFARDSHKRGRESWHEVGEYTARIPARPYLPFSGPPNAPVLQPEAERGMQDIVVRITRRAHPTSPDTAVPPPIPRRSG
ncbi:phage virion morphogenesis protein [Burkholderia aenigmatica]|uniref:Phage virion morphogenesis protein n=3 Tax=Burkholderiaceae TaxID=119060 RepID=A0A6J5J561_9BURK|nr:phage virion morphogenesis protein [Burkholderia aenigmatica]VWC37074.1 phage virion morphogenesis protein [Burkholderia aenigmatica]